MSSITERIEQLKNRYLQNKYNSTILNEITPEINNVQNNTNAIDLSKTITSLRKTVIKQIIENDQCNANICKRHLCTTQTAGRPKKYMDKDVLEHMKNIGMCNVEIANLFSVHRNLVARCIND